VHARLIVLVDREDNDTSLEARQAAESLLELHNFVGGGGLFASPPADWFVIGGRWSGFLQVLRYDPHNKWDAFWKEFYDRKLDWRGEGFPPGNKQTERAEELFRQFFPDFEGEPPIYRDPYRSLGYEDDAQVLDETLFKFLKRIEDYAQGGDLYEGGCFVDLDNPYDGLKPGAIGRKWVILVDFHS